MRADLALDVQCKEQKGCNQKFSQTKNEINHLTNSFEKLQLSGKFDFKIIKITMFNCWWKNGNISSPDGNIESNKTEIQL